jgi:hypothetical protein
MITILITAFALMGFAVTCFFLYVLFIIYCED